MPATDEFVRLKDAPTLVGVNKWTLTRRIAAGELDGVRDPRDRRYLLVRRADLETLFTPTTDGNRRRDGLAEQAT
jgi:hypothetical protein